MRPSTPQGAYGQRSITHRQHRVVHVQHTQLAIQRIRNGQATQLVHKHHAGGLIEERIGADGVQATSVVSASHGHQGVGCG